MTDVPPRFDLDRTEIKMLGRVYMASELIKIALCIIAAVIFAAVAMNTGIAPLFIGTVVFGGVAVGLVFGA